MKRLLLRGSAVGIVVVTFIAGGAMGATAIRGRGGNADSLNAQSAVQDTSADPSPTVAPAAAPLDSTPRAPVVAPAPSPAPAPIVSTGTSWLADSVAVVRSDTDVVVAFDRPEIRTRRADKLERFIRATLPAIYGPLAGEALTRIPDGTLVPVAGLLDSVPRRGLRVPLTNEWALRVYPETRAGQDGPLVIRYRARVRKTGE
jgi:hypothetical protein